VLPMRRGQVERRTHDYRRHGTTTLFAALNVKTSDLITQFHQRHRSIEFRQFLDAVDATVPRHARARQPPAMTAARRFFPPKISILTANA
jgi:hypothetical protein